MFTYARYRAEGRKDDYTTLTTTASSKWDYLEYAVAMLAYDVKQLRNAGAEVIQEDKHTFLVIDSSDNVSQVLTII